jgi:hypothetical protein
MATKKSASKKGAKKKAAAKRAATGAAAVPSAAKLKTVQSKLNADPRLRSRFLRDPGGVLRQNGVTLDPSTESALAIYTRGLTAPQMEVFGAQLIRIRVGIRVRIRIIINIGKTL